jgi:hypothetical protein
MNDGRMGVIIGYSSSLGAFSVAVQGDNDESYCILEWRNDFMIIDIKSRVELEKEILVQRLERFNKKIEEDDMRSFYVGWRDATEMELKFVEELIGKL